MGIGGEMLSPGMPEAVHGMLVERWGRGTPDGVIREIREIAVPTVETLRLDLADEVN